MLPRSRAMISSLTDVISGMSCSITTSAAPVRSRMSSRIGPGAGDVASVEDDAALVGRQITRDEVEDRGLAGPVGADETEDLALPHAELDTVHGADAAEADGEAAHLEERLEGLALDVGGDVPTFFDDGGEPAGLAVARHRSGPFEEHGTQDVGALEELARGTVEAHLALLHEHSALREREGDVDRLLDQDDGHAVVVDALHHLEQLLHYERGETEGKLVDHQQLGP